MPDTDALPGTERFEVLRPLGRGGFGEVWAVRDRVRGLDVALKRLHHLGADALLRFKREFRALADLRHDNLVRLYELHAGDDGWYYTMELVDGVAALDRTSTTTSGTGQTWALSSLERPDEADLPPLSAGALPEDQVRSLFAQLARGLSALHASGKLHRDLKPGNVLVTPQGRVVVLDFGLVGDRGEEEVLRAGTPAYMAPEQVDGAATTASDWYAFGLMLYEALTGERPFGAGSQMLRARRSFDGPDPREVNPGLPGDLAGLCVRLLRRRPEERPGEVEILEVFGARAAAPVGAEFVGREAEIERILGAIEHPPALVAVRAASGMGKTALVRHALRDLDAIVLAGRCWERESVPFKALDGVVDDLARALGDGRLRGRLPPGFGGLVRLFPVLEPIQPDDAAPEPTGADAWEERRRAAGALRDVLARLAEERPVVLWIDDAHWGDADSAGLLRELFVDPPPVALIASWRVEADDAGLPEALRGLASRFAVHETLDLGGLADDDARRLAASVLGDDAARIEPLLREANGHPMFLGGLARLARTGSAAGLTLADVIGRQVAGLRGGARTLLEVLAVAGRPLPRRIARHAAGLGEGFEDAFAALEGERLLRFAGLDEDDTVEPYHDRIRETVAAGLAPDALAARHRALADALSAAGAEPEERLAHLIGAGRRDEAATVAELAAERASAALAFDHAAELYATAIELGADRVRLLPKRAEALSHAGRGEAAARAWLEAADGAPDQALVLRTRAAEAWLNAGHLTRGLEVLDLVLRPLGMRVAPRPWQAFAAMGLTRARIALRGLEVTPRAEAEVEPELLRKIDACLSAATGLAVIDTPRGSEFQMRLLWLALHAGEPERLARALAMEIAFLATSGPRAAARIDATIERARALAAARPSPEMDARLEVVQGIRTYLFGRYPEAAEPLARSEERLRRLGGSVSWELNTARIFRIDSLRWAGRWAELARRSAAYTTEAEDTGNLHLRTYMAFARSATLAPAWNQPEEGRELMRQAIGWWSDDAYRVQHWWAWYAFVDLDVLEGRFEDAWARASGEWPRIRGSLLLAVEVVRVFSNYLRGKAAAAVAKRRSGAGRWHPLAVARWDLAMVRSSRCGHARVLEHLLAADLAAATGREDRALDALRAGMEAADRDGYAMMAASARWHLGRGLGGDEGRALVAAAEAAMRAEGVRDPEALARMYLAAQG